jgi:hypothetical protein
MHWLQEIWLRIPGTISGRLQRCLLRLLDSRDIASIVQEQNSLSPRLRISPLFQNFQKLWALATGIFSTTTVGTPEFLVARGL